MNKIRKWISALLIITMLFALCSCAEYDKNANIYFELNEIPKTVDAQTAESFSELVAVRNIYEGLMRKNAEGEIALGVAESYEYKNLTYTFIIRDDAVWSDGTPLTAYDFQFALKRALIPDTNSPFADKLYSIKNARAIHNGNLDADNLGVTVLDDHTLEITLEYDDKDFIHTLATSVAMPCNEDFFKNAVGKYGLTAEYTLSNGSYKLSRWNQENFKIKLSKNENYNGDFKAKNGAVFLTRNEEETSLSLLQNDDVDISFIDCALTEEAEKTGLKTYSFDNTCWVLTISDALPYNIRKSLALLCGGDVIKNKLDSGYRIADSLFPSACLENSAAPEKFTDYNIDEGKQLYFNSINELEDKKFPSETYLSYYNDGYSKDFIAAIAGHWQNNLGAYVNIEEVDSVNKIIDQLTNQTRVMAIFPVTTVNNNLSEYLKKFGFEYNDQELSEIQNELLKSYNIVPLAFSNTTIAYGNGIKDIVFDSDNGYIDFAFVTKEK